HPENQTVQTNNHKVVLPSPLNYDLAETGFILFCISIATKICFQLIKSIIVNSVLIIAFYINP
uniref:hypothetical protein n=1 Tax=Bacteroides stercoris TaxID=46506 RepID=UPI00356690C6